MTETRELKGEIEGWAREVKEFGKNNRGSIGFKVDGDWHNIVGKVDELKGLEEIFPKGTNIKFKEKKNNRGYWDVEGALTTIGSETQINKTEEIKTPTQGLITLDRNKDILLQVAFKGAIEITKQNEKPSTNDHTFTDHTIAWVMDMTEKLYKGLNKTKLNLQEKSEW